MEETVENEKALDRSFLLRILPDDVVTAKHEIGETYKSIKMWSLRMHVLFLLLFAMGILVFFRADNPFLALVPLILIFVFRSISMFQARNAYKSFQLQRHYEFLYFFSLLVPHLSGEAGATMGLYNVLGKLEERLKPEGVDGSDGVLKAGVNRLIIQMTNAPGSIEPFLVFARECSGTELATDISIALFDFQQNSDEQDAILRLKRKVNKDLEKRIEDIVDMKISKFRWYSERLVMSVFVLVLGILGAAIWGTMGDAFNHLPG